MTDTIKHIGQLFTDFLNYLIYFNLVTYSSKIKIHILYWTKAVTDSNLTHLLSGKKNVKKKKNAFRVRSSNLSQALRQEFVVHSPNGFKVSYKETNFSCFLQK